MVAFQIGRAGGRFMLARLLHRVPAAYSTESENEVVLANVFAIGLK